MANPLLKNAQFLNQLRHDMHVIVGEDIMWHTSNGTEYMFVTFMGGRGEADGGSVGVFDAQTNAVVKVIEARKSVVGEGNPYIMYPHGISAYKL